MSATCIVAREIDAPKGVKPVEWRLLTNRAAPTLADAIELIDWYRARWEIEIYFNVLKNGCKVEALQLSAIDRIERALALFMIVAWRVAYLMRVGRTCPNLDAALFFDPDDIRGAYLLSKKPQPAEPPRLNEVLRLIAQQNYERCARKYATTAEIASAGRVLIWILILKNEKYHPKNFCSGI